MTSFTPLKETDLPGLGQAADDSSVNAQRIYRLGTAGILLALVVAAVGGALPADFITSGTDWAGVLAATAFLVSIVLQGYLAQNRPERTWYEGRAIAESAKSLGWQFAVGGGDYAQDDPLARHRLIDELEALLKDIGDAKPFDLPADTEQVSSAMEALRAESLSKRRAAYRVGRIQDQRTWYSEKARWNRKRASVLLGVVVGLQVVGGSAAVLRASGVISVDLLGIAAAMAAGAVAWIQLKDHVQLDEAYSLASHDLGLIADRIDAAQSEEEWRSFVANAEQAISREHRMWRAARSTRLR